MRFVPLALAALAALAVPAARSEDAGSDPTPVGTSVPEPGWKGLPGAKDPGEPGKAPGWTEVDLKITPAPKDWPFRTPRDSIQVSEINRGAWVNVTGGALPYIGAKGGQAIRFFTGTSKGSIDLDGDGQGETPLQEMLAARLKRPDGTDGPHHFRLRRDGDLYWLNRACMSVGKIEDTPVAFVDENNDGDYGDTGEDAVRIGSAGVAQYMSEVVNVRNKLYYLRVNQSATKAWYKPYEGPTGTVDLVSGYKGKSKPLFAMVRQGEIIVDAGAGKDTIVPAGTWSFYEGLVGPTIQQSARIMPGRMQPISVAVGGRTSLAWGMQGILEFSCTKSGNMLHISTGSIQIFGQAGEQYQDFRPKKFTPDVRVVDERSKKDIVNKNMGAGC